jgi:TolB-like protein/DNA-binding winged helix-turn-helix (wHTH) protein/Tfp pilus assembly protein PilF
VAQHDSQSACRFRFGLFEADPHLGMLTKQGKRLPLQELPFRTLLMLLERRGELVTRDELHQQLWPDTIVDFDHGLNKAINKIRDVLGDSASNPRFIETVARRGYRFLADVTLDEPVAQVGSVAQVGPTDADAEAAPPAAKRRPLRWILLGIAGVLLFASVMTWKVVGPWQSAMAVRSIAVLPLQNLSGDASQDYFADGMTDELITQLAQISELRVISRSSVMTYKNAHKPLPEIARELNVQAIVEGSVVSSGPRVRITAQLIRVPADEHIWANNYEGDLRDTLRLQGEVARAIAAQVRVKLSPREQAALKVTREVNPQAHEAYLKGRYFWNKRTGTDLKSAIDYFNTAIAIDPDYAAAFAGLADSYALAGDWEYGLLSPQEAWPKANAAAKRALALDSGLGPAHASLAFAMDLYTWDWSAAEAEYQRAIALSPNYATAHHWYGFHLLVTGHNQEAIVELRKAESLDPLSLIISADIADALCIAHLYDQSIEQSNKALAMDPNFAVAHYELGQALEQKALHAQAIAHYQRAIELGGHSAAFDSNLAHAYAVSGRKDEARRIVQQLEWREDQYPAAYANIALAYVGLGDADSAMTWLDKAYAAHVNPSILLRPGFDPLRTDPRFQSLLERIRRPN